MKLSIWHHTADQQPSKSGYYLTYRGWGMGGKADGDSDNGYLYYFAKSDQWYEYESEIRSGFPRTCIVYYWTDADPAGWVDKDPPVSQRKKTLVEKNAALDIAWKNVEEAIRKYEVVKALSGNDDD